MNPIQVVGLIGVLVYFLGQTMQGCLLCVLGDNSAKRWDGLLKVSFGLFSLYVLEGLIQGLPGFFLYPLQCCKFMLN
jgi:predicted ABC-type sugar transport system permease subunit